MAPESWTSGHTEIELDEAAASEAMRALFFDDTIRSRMTKLLRRTIVKLSESHQLIATHLEASVVTGYGCRYRPAGAGVQWSLDPDR